MPCGIVRSGALWGAEALAAEWKGVDEDVRQELCHLARHEFECRAEAEGLSLVWIPAMSVVLADIAVVSANRLFLLRKQVIADVWQSIDGDGGPLDEQVQDILGA